MPSKKTQTPEQPAKPVSAKSPQKIKLAIKKPAPIILKLRIPPKKAESPVKVKTPRIVKGTWAKYDENTMAFIHRCEGDSRMTLRLARYDITGNGTNEMSRLKHRGPVTQVSRPARLTGRVVTTNTFDNDGTVTVQRGLEYGVMPVIKEEEEDN